MQYISTPKVQAQQAVTYGETPDNKLACADMDKLQAGSCAQYHANAPQSYFDTISAVEDAARDVRQRPERLRALRPVGVRVGHAGQVAAA